jgi:aqualysin 1
VFRPQVSVPEPETGDLVKTLGGRVHFVYGHALRGFAATLSPKAVEKLRRDRRVALIEEDRTVEATQLPLPQSPQTPAPSWALDRIDQRGGQLDNSFSFPASGGAGVHIYIVDSGILGGILGQAGAHVEFEGRVGDGFDSITPGGNANDCLGHGTLVASLAAGTTYGVAKLATLHPVRVLDCLGGGSSSGVIAGVNWVTSDHLSHPGQKSVANMSLTLNGIDLAVDQAVQNSINAGVVYSIAAGNSGGRIDIVTGADLGNACNLSPQRVGAALTVGAMDDTAPGAPDRITNFSDTGGCVDLYAPGVIMTGADFRSTTGITGPPFTAVHHNGTSYSAPLVAGVAATFFASHPNANASQVASAITSNATVNALIFPDVPNGPNRLLYSDFQTDVQTTVSANNGAPPAGSQFAYTFIIHNNGPFNTMDSVLFTDNLPANVGSVNFTSTRGNCSGITQISCDLGRMAVGEQAVITIAVTAPLTPQSFTNTGTATLQSGQTDRAPANNSASVTLTSR